MWTDIASIVFVCVTINHMGLISAIEDIIGKQIPIADCPKCLTFWCVLLYCLLQTYANTYTALAISFLMSYTAIWLELAEGIIDTLYLKLYDTISKTDNKHETTSDTCEGNT